MNILIIEDELPARAKLIQLLARLRDDVNIVGEVGSVYESIDWLKRNRNPDLAFMDIQLSDSYSFEIFRSCNINFPVVFTTAYDKYILESFEYNSIDYLLKPISEEKLERALTKVAKLRQHFLQTIGNLDIIREPNTQRIIVKKGTELVALPTIDVAYFFTEHKIVFAKDFLGRKLIIDKTLGELESILNHNNFFRLNRKFIAQKKAIEKFKPENGKVRVFLMPEVAEEVHVSKETSREFKNWIGK